jgi:nitronate monooxygenase
MLPTVMDKDFKTKYVKNRLKKYKFNVNNPDKSAVQFDLDEIAETSRRHVREVMSAKVGSGGIFVNCMEKLTMNNPKDTLQVRLNAAMDEGIDGITLSAGLHLGSFALIKDHPRFRETALGIIVSSVRALKLFLRKAKGLDRFPDYVVVEGPLAGGHLGFGLDWADFDLKVITAEVIEFLQAEGLSIPVIAAGGIFTGLDASNYMELGVNGVQVATRFTVTKECGLPDDVKQKYFAASEEEVVVNTISPTGYPMRMLSNSPAIGAGIRPNCESYGYVLDKNGQCAYVKAYNKTLEEHPGERKISVKETTCLCTHMRKFKLWTCGHYTYRLKDTSYKDEDGVYALLDAAHVFKDYQYNISGAVARPGESFD